MKTITVADDVYDFLKNASELGEDTSSLMRRLLKMPNVGTAQAGATGTAALLPKQAEVKRSGIHEALTDRRFKIERTAVERFVFLLAWLHGKHRDKFREVLSLGGRSRRYFARSLKELEDSGTSVNPRQIPNSEFWVVTNNDTQKKEEILRDAMQLLGYDSSDLAAIKGKLNYGGEDLDDIL